MSKPKVKDMNAKVPEGQESVSTKSGATHLTDENGKLPLWIKTLFAVPRFTIRASYIIQSAYITYFYETIGAKLTYIAAYVAIARSFDVITDPLMGWMSDNTHSPFGRRKPYMAIGTVFYNMMMLFLLNPPRSMAHPGISHWFGVTYTLFYLFDTFTSIPYYAFGMELTNDFDERDQLWMWNQVSGNFGTLVGMGLPAALTYATGSLYDVWLITGLVFCAVHISGMSSTVALIKEAPQEQSKSPQTIEADQKTGAKERLPLQDPLTNATAEAHSSPFVVNLLRCMRNEPFDYIIRSYFLDYLGLGMISAMLPFYVGYVLLRPEGGNTKDADKTVVTTAFLGVAVFVAAFLSVPVWENISRRYGKYKAWIYYSIWNAITCPFFAICGTNKAAAYIVAFMNGSAVGGQFLLDSIVNDVAEYDTMLHGDSIEGCFVAIQTFVPKIVLVAAMSIPFAILVALGFESSRCTFDDDNTTVSHDPDSCSGDERAPEPQSELIRWTIVTFFCIIPTIATLVSIYYKLLYPIKTAELSEKISVAREEHSRGLVALDPLKEKDRGPLCISRVNDPVRRRALMTLAHFSDEAVQKYYDNYPDISFMAFRIKCWNIILHFLCFFFFVIACSTFSWLEGEGAKWKPSVPILSFVLWGGFLIFAYVMGRIQAQLKVLGDGSIIKEDVKMYLDKLNGK